MNHLEAAGFQPDALDAQGLARLLHLHGYQPEDRAAVRAFGRVIQREELEDIFLADFLSRESAPVDAAAATAEANFCNELLNVCFWDGDPEWFNRLARLWCNCCDAGVDARFVWVCTGALLSACRERLVGGRAEIFQLELDLLTGLVRVVWALAAHLSEVSVVRARTHAARGAGGLSDLGLPDRVWFETMLESMVAAATPDSRLGLVLVRLQSSPVTEAMMPGEREAIRRVLSVRWREALRSDDVLCVLGEQEWAVLQPGVQSAGQVLLAANKLRDLAHGALSGVDLGEGVDVVIGGACAPDDGADAMALERAARDALNVGGRGRQGVTLFGEAVARAMKTEHEAEREFLRAMHLQRFELYLQPQINSTDGQCPSAEALLRWQRDDGKWMPPPAIFDLATRLGQQTRLTRMLVARIARMADELARSGVPVRVMLNLTAEDLHDPELPDLVQQSMANWRVAPGQIGFEITEGAVLSDDPVVESVLNRLRALKAFIALDDFGTGYSSLAHLRRLPVDELKVDRQFVAGMHAHPQDRAIVEAVLALARAFELETVAEGVETSVQSKLLKEMGCARLQGNLISPAVPASRFVTWWLARSRSSAAPTT